MNLSKIPKQIEAAKRLYGVGETLDNHYSQAFGVNQDNQKNDAKNPRQIEEIITRIETKLGESVNIPFLLKPFIDSSSIDDCKLQIVQLRKILHSEQITNNCKLVLGCFLAGILSAFVSWNLRGANLDLQKKTTLIAPVQTSFDLTQNQLKLSN